MSSLRSIAGHFARTMEFDPQLVHALLQKESKALAS